MRNNYLFISILILMLPIAAWGQTSSPTTLYIDKGAITIGSTSISGCDQSGNQVTATNADGYIIMQTDANTATDKNITISSGTTATITLHNVNIKSSAAFDASAATKITLYLKGNNTLESTNQHPALYAPQYSNNDENKYLIIEAAPDDSNGSLKATGAKYWPGIGCQQGYGSIITINSGNITAIGGAQGAGIGASFGISGGYNGTITINGGTVTATGGKDATGIGGAAGKHGTFTIKGGVVFASSIGNKSNTGKWVGIVFENKQGAIYGKNVGITTDVTIPSDHALTIGNDQALIIDGCTLTVDNATLTVQDGGKIATMDEGKISGYNGTITTGYKVTYHANYENSTETEIQYFTEKTATIENPFTRQYYTLKGWYTDATDETGGTITEVSTTTDLYAHWELNTFTLNLTAPTLTYGSKMTDITLSRLLSTDAEKNCGTINIEVSSTLPAGLECKDGVISGTPTAASTDEGSKVTITATAENTSTATQEVTFKVNKALLTVTPKSNQILYKGEEPEFDHSGEVNDETAAFEGKLKVNTENNTIELGELELKDSSPFRAANYELKMSLSSVTCTYHDVEPGNATATIAASTGNPSTEINGVNWYNDNVTITAPEGFTIRQKVNPSRNAIGNELTLTTEGSQTVSYILTRRTTDYEKTATFGIDLNAPAVSVQSNNLAFTLTATDGEGSGIASAQIDGTDVTLTKGEYKGNASAGTHTYLVTDKVGRTTEGSFTLTAYTPPPYVPSYYDIHLEPNDSVRLSTTGTTVEEGYSFTLTAEVAEGYDPATLVVEYRKGRSGSWQALKAESSGKYRIRSVYSDIYIRASVRPLDDPTALETVGDGKSHIRTGGGIVYIETPVPQRVTVFTLDGRLIRHESLPAGDSQLYGLPAGLYVIRLQDGTTVKGLVRR